MLLLLLARVTPTSAVVVLHNVDVNLAGLDVGPPLLLLQEFEARGRGLVHFLVLLHSATTCFCALRILDVLATKLDFLHVVVLILNVDATLAGSYGQIYVPVAPIERLPVESPRAQQRLGLVLVVLPRRVHSVTCSKLSNW